MQEVVNGGGEFMVPNNNNSETSQTDAQPEPTIEEID